MVNLSGALGLWITRPSSHNSTALFTLQCAQEPAADANECQSDSRAWGQACVSSELPNAICTPHAEKHDIGWVNKSTKLLGQHIIKDYIINWFKVFMIHFLDLYFLDYFSRRDRRIEAGSHVASYSLCSRSWSWIPVFPPLAPGTGVAGVCPHIWPTSNYLSSPITNDTLCSICTKLIM